MIVHQIYFDFGTNTASRDAGEASRVFEVVRSHMSGDSSYIRWELDASIALVRKHYPCFLPIFEMETEFQVMKCDFFRYLLMYHFGGIYFDLDFVPTKPVESIFNDTRDRRVFHFPVKEGLPNVIFSEEWSNSMSFTDTLHNGILFSRNQRHPIWMELMMSIYDTLCVRGLRAVSHKDVYRFTGPNLLCDTVRKSLGTYTDVVVLPYFYCCPYMAVCKNTRERIVCNGLGDVPPLETHDWVFFSSEVAAQLSLTCPSSYFVCVHLNHGSLWK